MPYDVVHLPEALLAGVLPASERVDGHVGIELGDVVDVIGNRTGHEPGGVAVQPIEEG